VAYSAQISRNNPTCFVFLVDQSGSMMEPFAAQPDKSKSDGVADAINRLLQNLVLKCAKADGIRDFFHVGLIAYGGRVVPAFSGALNGRSLVPISAIAKNPLRVEQRKRRVDDGVGGLVEQQFKFPVWFDPKPMGKTPMCAALALAKTYVQDFLTKYPACYPPLVINITDGEASDGDPNQPAQEIQQLRSQDGNALLFNAHLSTKRASPVEFPENAQGLVDKFAKALFQMSSPLPPKLLEAAKAEGYPVGPLSRGFVFNADLVSVVRFLDIGTRVSQSAR
jgi:hypothetical protein